ncbi:hypothetical protein SprV_0702351000 [Sparganum proliferum]
MGEIGINMLLQRIAEQAREQRIIRDAELEKEFRKLPNPMSPRNDKLVHNLSSNELTKDQMQVLRHEALFNTTDAKPVNMIAAVESVLCQTEATEETKSLIRHQMSSLLMAHRPREVLSKVERAQDGAPLRPIVSLKGTPTYGLAMWLFWRLKFLTVESGTTVSSSAQFLEELKGDLAIETIELLLQSKYNETENSLGRAQVLQLLKSCLRTHFTFDGTIYEQVKGTPMGSPISGFIAEAVLQRLESLVFQHHKPKFWARYVDDTFVVIERDQLLTFKERLNAVFPDIQFTMEEEENNQLAFLDVLVCRKDCGGLKTKVFRKATNTMQVLNFNSNHPISHKRSYVRTLYRRVETHCSEPEDKIAELKYLRRVFKANGYPRNFVNRCIRKRDERPNRTDTKCGRAIPKSSSLSVAQTSATFSPGPLSVDGMDVSPDPNIERWWKSTYRRAFIIRPPTVNRSIGPEEWFLYPQTISKVDILNNDIFQESWIRIPSALTFADLANIEDAYWRLPINPAVFNLYPQAVDLEKLLQLVKRDRISPIEPIFNQSVRYLRLPKNVCDRSAQPGRQHSVVIIVKSGIYNFRNRQLLRDAYLGQVNDQNSEIAMVFSLGIPRQSGGRLFQRDGYVVSLPDRAGDSLDYYQARPLEVMTLLRREDEANHDLIIGDYEDTYYNLTLKMLHSFQWAAGLCASQKPTFVFADDDFAFSVDKIRQIIANRSVSARGKMAVGVLRRASESIRHGKSPAYEKWSVSKREIPWPIHAPHTSGAFYMLGYEVVEELAAGMYFTRPLSLDDVWLGMIATKLGVSYEQVPGMYQFFDPKIHRRKEALFTPYEVLFTNPLRWIWWLIEPISKNIYI